MQEADHHRLDPFLSQAAHRRAHLVDRERFQHRALGVEPLAHLEAPASGHQGRRLLEVHVVEPGADLAADLQDVAEAPGHEHAHARDLALDDGVGRHGRGVDDRGHVAALGPAFREAALQRAHETLGRILRRGQHLDHPHPAGPGVHEGGVGESAADVDADSHGPLRASAHRVASPTALALTSEVAAASRAPVAGSTTTP
jgi:hypothetical protein